MENHEKRPLPEARTYTVEDVAAMLNIGRTSAYTLVKEGHFKTVRIGTAIRISKKSFDEWVVSSIGPVDKKEIWTESGCFQSRFSAYVRSKG